jgi:GNAT superfamily N-acetyltransferase
MSNLATNADLYRIRPFAEGDRSLVISSWVKNYGAHSSHGRAVDPRVYGREQSRLVERLLEECETWVAIDPTPAGKVDSIFGFVTGERGIDVDHPSTPAIPTVHYLWVNAKLRQRGIGRSLLAMIAPRAAEANVGAPWDPVEAAVYYTHFPNVNMGEAVRRIAPGAIFNPYRLIDRERGR